MANTRGNRPDVEIRPAANAHPDAAIVKPIAANEVTARIALLCQPRRKSESL